jgi:hypothetical protein
VFNLPQFLFPMRFLYQIMHIFLVFFHLNHIALLSCIHVFTTLKLPWPTYIATLLLSPKLNGDSFLFYVARHFKRLKLRSIGC